jgi:hypothetical protein
LVAASTSSKIDEATGVDLHAGGTLSAGLRGDAGLAVQALRKNPGERGLADARGSGKEVGVMQALLLQRMPQRPHNVLLTYQAGEIPRPPFSLQVPDSS